MFEEGMSPRLRMFKAKELKQALKQLGFIEIRQRGSHLFFEHPDGRITSLPIHGGNDIGRGLFRQILREIDMTPDEFLECM